MKISGTLDIECSAWDRFAVACTYEPGVGIVVHRSIEALVDHLLARPGRTWWAHCGGRYDALAVAEELHRRGVPCSMDLAGPRVTRLCGGGFVLRDSWPLVPFGLDVAAPLAGEVAPVLGLPCSCAEPCGGYCSIRPGDTRAAVSDYCAADARVLYRVLVALREHAQDLGFELRGTIGGTAWATAKARLGLPNAELRPSLWRTIREAYYGGRTTICRPLAAGPGTHWDLSSAYPAALASCALPVGEHGVYSGSDARGCLRRERPGVYAATVDVPEMYLPPLPVRTGERITYPWGRLRGAWTLPELRTAIARGAKVADVRWCVVWEAETVLFDGLMREWFAARRKAGKKTPLGMWLREVANSFTGKLAEQPNRRGAKMFPDKIRYCRGKRPCSVKRCTGACGAMEQLDIWGHIWSVPFFRPATSGHVQWAAYLTSACREMWLRGAESQGDDLVYGATDSIWTTSRKGPRPQGSQLGRWEYKHGWSEWQCVAPGAYRYLGDDGKTIVRTSGFSATEDEWLAGSGETTRGVLGFVEAAATGRGLFQRRAQSWKLPDRGRETGIYGDRLLSVDDGLTYPVRAD